MNKSVAVALMFIAFVCVGAGILISLANVIDSQEREAVVAPESK